MAQPKMFDDDDPILGRLREVCIALPGADMKVSHGRPVFFTKKIFAIYGAVVKGEHNSGRYDRALLFMPDANEAAAYQDDDRIFSPAYWGPYGWLGLDLSPADIDWDEVAELVEDSYRATATKRLVSELEER